MEKWWAKKIIDGVYHGTKTLPITDFEIKSEGDATYIVGYANTKNQADAYGDIPTSFKEKNVYDLKSRFKNNPVALVDHNNSVGSIFGAFVLGDGATFEDELGLKIKLRLMENPKTEIAQHAVEAYKSGYARAFSIGGRWLYEDKENPTHLTKAIIHEISGVAIGADPRALSHSSKPKTDEAEKATSQETAESLIAKYRLNPDPKIIAELETLRRAA